jgi:hypothetical protein
MWEIMRQMEEQYLSLTLYKMLCSLSHLKVHQKHFLERQETILYIYQLFLLNRNVKLSCRKVILYLKIYVL